MAQLKDTTITGGLSVSGTVNITGATQTNNDVTLYKSSGDSPSIIFQRGTSADNLNDYKITDSGGYLTIKQQGNSSTSGFTQVAQLTNQGTFTVSTPPTTDTTPSVTSWISPTDSSVKISTDATIASGDKLVIRDSSDSNKMRSSSISFGTSTSTYLRNDGTWGTPSGGGSGGTESGVEKFVNRTSLHTLLGTSSIDTRYYGTFSPVSYASAGVYNTTLSYSADDISTAGTYTVSNVILVDIVFLYGISMVVDGTSLYGYRRVNFDWWCSEFSYNSSTGKYEATLSIYIDSSMSNTKITNIYYIPIVKPYYYITM